MSRDACIRAAIEAAGVRASVQSTRNLSGGCIHEVLELILDDGDRLVAKLGRAEAEPIFQEESRGLSALAETRTVVVPKPLATIASGTTAVLLMTALRPAGATTAAWKDFGERLAMLHTANVGRQYGFEIDNHLGSTPQPNQWCDDWVRFNADHRLGHQLTLARKQNRLTEDEAELVQRLIDELDRLLPRNPRPSLLHGDLWSGNALPTTDESDRVAIGVIDPAPYVGDGWADIAMMKLFGGFPSECLEAYAAHVDDHDRLSQRIAVYQLYHVLNHVNLFGRGYVGHALELARQATR